MMNICEILGIKFPILLSPMAGVTTPQLAAEVSNAGALGALGLGASSSESCREQILATQALTQKPFQVNFFCHQTLENNVVKNQQWLDYVKTEFDKFNAPLPKQLNCIYDSFLAHDKFLQIILDTGVKIVSFHFGIPHKSQLMALKQSGVITLATATNVNEAIEIEQAGIDIVVAQGIEAGGHRGIFHSQRDGAISTLELVQLLTKSVQCPIVAAGGLMTGQDCKLMLESGANAVQLGTAFVQCASSNANQAYRKALFSQAQTQITQCISGRPARGLVNAWHSLDTVQRPDVADYPYAYDVAKQLHSIASQQGCQDYAAFWAGMGVAKIRDLSAPDLVNTLVQEMGLTQ